MYLSEYDSNQIVEVAAGTNTITPFATLPYTSQLALGPNGRLYAVSDPSPGRARLDRSDMVVRLEYRPRNTVRGQSSLLGDIAFAPALGYRIIRVRRLRRLGLRCRSRRPSR